MMLVRLLTVQVWLNNSRPITTSGCPTYNEYKYGLDNFTYKSVTPSFPNAQYGALDVIYNYGSSDNDPNFVPADTGCEVQTQGNSHATRMQNYWSSLLGIYGDGIRKFHRLTVTPGGDHSSYANQYIQWLSLFSPINTSGYPVIESNATSVGCFVDAASHRVLPGPSFTSNSMDIDTCVSFCSTQGYAYAGVEWGQECYCGSTIPTVSSGAVCNIPCFNNFNEYCGGVGAISVYETDTTVTLFNSTSIGCYKDFYPDHRALPNASTTSSQMSSQFCGQFCSSKGYSYYGTEYGDECYCGNDISQLVSLSSSSCQYTCAGWSSQYCGGSNALSLYSTALPAVSSGNTTASSALTSSQAVTTSSTASSSSSTISVTSSSSSTVSSSLSTSSSSASSSSTTSSSSSTISSISAYTSSSSYSATTFSTSSSSDSVASTSSASTTYYSNSSSMASTSSTSVTSLSTSTLTSASLTTTPQPGGLDVVSSSTTSSSSTSSTSSTSPTSTPVCLTDGYPNSRTLSAASFVSKAMTNELCSSYCFNANYKYSGTEYSDECYCSQSISNYLGVGAPSTGCNMPCAGNSAEICGGSNAILVSTNPTPPSESGYSGVGCRSDGYPNTRSLNGPNYWSSTMTPQVCLDYCFSVGQKYAGVEYGYQCFCASTLDPNSVALPASSCAMTCQGDSTMTCGGSNTLQVYVNAAMN